MRFSSARLKHMGSASDFRRPMLIAFGVRQCDLQFFLSSKQSHPSKSSIYTGSSTAAAKINLLLSS